MAEMLKIRGLTDVESDDAETMLTESPKPNLNNLSSSGDAHMTSLSRKRRRYDSGDDNNDEVLQRNNNRSRSTSPYSNSTIDYLDSSIMEPILSAAAAAQNRHSSASTNSSNNSTPALGGAVNGHSHSLNSSVSNTNSNHSISSNPLLNHPGINSSSSPNASSLASSLSSLAAHIPGAMPPPGVHGMPPMPAHLAGIGGLPPLNPLSPLLNMHHPAMRHHPTQEDMEIRPAIAEMIREEERVSSIIFYVSQIIKK